MKVLIAEDDRTSRSVLKGALAKLGYEAVEAADGAAAWDALGRIGARIIVSDWVMPDCDGLELCRRVRARKGEPYAYFILLTGKMLGAGHYEEAMAEGVDDFLTKPLDVDALRIRLRVAERIVQLTERVRTLEGILPMCAYCRRIRDERGKYQGLEDYVSDKTPAQFSHGVCPECAEKHFKD
ncbi:MAG: response regulator [Elusimicrobiota bacterium]|nr:MAG: response regulator [Elusimicrobiota bacterium]